MKVVIFVANRSFALWGSRRDLIIHFIENNYKVVALTKSGDEFARKLEEIGVVIEPIDVERGGFSLWKDINVFITIVKAVRQYNPVLIHSFHAKNVIFSSMIGKIFAGNECKIVNTITGLGYAFSQDSYTKKLALLGYKISQKFADKIIFQNPDDLELFQTHNICTLSQSELIVSSGVDINKYHRSSIPKKVFICLFVGRLLKQKGVIEFLEAARIIKNKYPDILFQLGGELEKSHPDGVLMEDVVPYIERGDVEYLGYISNMPQKLHSVSLFVFPSYYREGVPRVVLEAASSGVPVIIADEPGTKEAVIDGHTGFLIPSKNSKIISDKIIILFENKELYSELSSNSVLFIKDNFDIKLILKKYVNVYISLGINIDGY